MQLARLQALGEHVVGHDEELLLRLHPAVLRRLGQLHLRPQLLLQCAQLLLPRVVLPVQLVDPLRLRARRRAE
eukprot:6409080-Prymnesium_polylepis.1